MLSLIPTLTPDRGFDCEGLSKNNRLGIGIEDVAGIVYLKSQGQEVSLIFGLRREFERAYVSLLASIGTSGNMKAPFVSPNNRHA
jgi:hypothetical protein